MCVFLSKTSSAKRTKDFPLSCRVSCLTKGLNGLLIFSSDFNPERLTLACASLRLSRVCAEDAYNYAIQRETFGSPLIEKQAIQSKIFKFGLMIEPAYAFMEQLVNILELTKDRPSDDVNIGEPKVLDIKADRVLILVYNFYTPRR